MAKGRIIAPYDTTQFLVSDHTEEPSSVYEKENNDNFYSSQSDEDFISKEFMKEYDIQQINRLEKMSKEMLLNEYLALERINEILEARLGDFKKREEYNERRKTDHHNGSEKILLFQQEIESLFAENKKLSTENSLMKERINQNSDSNSSSNSSSSSSSSESSDEEFDDNK